VTRRMLIVDDEETIRWALRELFMQDGWEVHCAADGDQAVELLGQNTYEFMITDLKLPGRPGVEVVREGRAGNADMGVLILTGYGSLSTAVEALRLGAWDYLTKPCDIRSLRRRVAEFAGRLDGLRAHGKPEPLTGEDVRGFLAGAGTEIMASAALSAGGACIEPLDHLKAALCDLGITVERSAELLQPCVEALAGWAGSADVCARAAVLKGHVLVSLADGRPVPSPLRRVLRGVGELFDVDVRVVETKTVHWIVITEGL